MQFIDAYNRLNQEQKEAVDTIYGPVAVIAGPGSGKTQLLSLRIAKILQDAEVAPESILCLTFTHSACETMRKRLVQLVGPTAYRVEIHTFHSFGALLLARIKGIKIDADIISDSESLIEGQVASRVRVAELLDGIIESLPFDHVLFRTLGGKEDRRSLIATLQGLFTDLKNEQITPESLAQIASILEGGRGVFDDFLLRYARQFDAIGPLRSKSSKESAQLVWHAMLQELPLILSGFDAGEMVSSTSVTPSHIWTGIFRDIMGTIYQNILDGEDVSISEVKKKIIEFAPSTEHTKSPLTLLIERVRGVADLFAQYASSMQERGYYDFQDLLSQAYTHIITHHSIQSELAEKYQFILIDEFQDTNELQLQLATSFLQNIQDPNILVVGDDDQAIYKFQGATIKNFQTFLLRYPQSRVIILRYNYRSTPQIIEFSRSIMQPATESVTSFLSLAQKEFVAARTGVDDDQVELRSYAQSVDEMASVIQDIRDHRNGGGQWSDCAILSRSNTTIRRYAFALMRQDIPCILSSDEYFENDEMVTQFVALSCVVGALAGYDTHIDPVEAFGQIITSGMYGQDRSHVWAMYTSLRESRTSLFEMITQMSLSEHLGVYGELMRFVLDVSMLVKQESVERVLDILTGERSLSASLFAPTQIDTNGQMSFGVNNVERSSPFYMACILQYKVSAPSLANARLHSFEVFVREVRDFLRDTQSADFSVYLHYLRLGGMYGFPSKLAPLFLTDQDAVILSTIHKAKGAEYPRVFVVASTRDEYTPKNRATLLPKSLLPPKDPQDINDERRLIYTACTRAQDSLVLTRPLESLSGRSSHPPESLSSYEWLPSPPVSTAERQEMLAVAHLSPDRIFWLPSDDELVFLKSRAALLSMNATLLSSFFEIADNGPEDFIRRSLLRLPSSSSILQIQGTAFHKGLEWWVSAHSRTGVYDDALFFEGVDAELSRSRLLIHEEEQVRDKITRLFPLIRETITSTGRDETFVEYPFGLAPGQEKIYLDDIPLTGKIDRIDTHNNGVLELYDYKTSKLQTSKLSYELQLSFYSVLMSLSRRFASFESRSYHLQALEPGRDGALARRSYYPSHGEIERDKKLIAYVYHRILACDFRVPESVHSSREWYEYILRDLGYEAS